MEDFKEQKTKRKIKRCRYNCNVKKYKNTLVWAYSTRRNFQPRLPSREQHLQRKYEQMLCRQQIHCADQVDQDRHTIRGYHSDRTETDGEISRMKPKNALILKCHKFIG